jgi:hypothetical protein
MSTGAVRRVIRVTVENPWTPVKVEQLRAWYTQRDGQPLLLDQLAKIVGKNRQQISLKAKELGLTKRSRPTGRKPKAKYATREESLAAVGAASRKRIAENGHPRGMLGKKHTPETLSRISASQQKLVAEGRHPGQRPQSDAQRAKQSLAMSERLKQTTSVYSRCHHGRRADLNDQFFRSRWEANYARFLNWLKAKGEIEKWEYEADTFWFEKIRRGVRSYTPDFKVKQEGATYYVEVKGWMDPKSKTKIKRMAKYHPAVELRVVDAKAYNELARKIGAGIPGWETDNRGRA